MSSVLCDRSCSTDLVGGEMTSSVLCDIYIYRFSRWRDECLLCFTDPPTQPCHRG